MPDFSRKRAWLRTDRAVPHDTRPLVTSTKNVLRAMRIVPHVGARLVEALLEDAVPPSALVEVQPSAAMTNAADADFHERDI